MRRSTTGSADLAAPAEDRRAVLCVAPPRCDPAPAKNRPRPRRTGAPLLGALAAMMLLLCAVASWPSFASATARTDPARLERMLPSDHRRRSEHLVTARLDMAPLLSRSARASCLERVQDASGPLLLIVGASFSAGTGAGTPTRAWSVDLVRRLGWRAIVVGAPGVGYLNPGPLGVGPIAAVLARLDLAKLAPSLLVIQAGHDDIGYPVGAERAQVDKLFASLRKKLPDTTLAAITVFYKGREPGSAAVATDRAILLGVSAADPSAILIDPLLGEWHFARSFRGSLHPSVRGDSEIAARVFSALRAQGVTPTASASRPAPALCILLAPFRPHTDDAKPLVVATPPSHQVVHRN